MACRALGSSPRRRDPDRTEHVVGKTKPRQRTEYGATGKTKPKRPTGREAIWQNETNSPARAQRVGFTSLSLHNDPALDAGAQCAHPFDVLDHFAGDRRRISVSDGRHSVREHRVAIAAAGEEVVRSEAIAAPLVERHIANLDRGDAAAGWLLEIDRKSVV